MDFDGVAERVAKWLRIGASPGIEAIKFCCAAGVAKSKSPQRHI